MDDGSSSGPLKSPRDDANALLLEVIRFLHETREHVELRDAVGHAPIGKKLRLRIVALSDGASRPSSPDDHAMDAERTVAIHRFQLECRHVDQNVAFLRRRSHQFEETAVIELQLRQALVRRHVESSQRRLVDAPRGTQAIALLIAHDRSLEAGVEM